MDLLSRNIYTDDVTDIDSPITSKSKKSLNKAPTTTTPRDKILLWKRPHTHPSWRRRLKQLWGKHVSFQVVRENNYYTGKNRHQGPESQQILLDCVSWPTVLCCSFCRAEKTTTNVLGLERKKMSCGEEEEELWIISPPAGLPVKDNMEHLFSGKKKTFPPLWVAFSLAHTFTCKHWERETSQTSWDKHPPPQIKRLT